MGETILAPMYRWRYGPFLVAERGFRRSACIEVCFPMPPELVGRNGVYPDPETGRMVRVQYIGELAARLWDRAPEGPAPWSIP